MEFEQKSMNLRNVILQGQARFPARLLFDEMNAALDLIAETNFYYSHWNKPDARDWSTLKPLVYEFVRDCLPYYGQSIDEDAAYPEFIGPSNLPRAVKKITSYMTAFKDGTPFVDVDAPQ